VKKAGISAMPFRTHAFHPYLALDPGRCESSVLFRGRESSSAALALDRILWPPSQAAGKPLRRSQGAMPLAHPNLKRLAQQDEPWVRILGSRSWLRLQRQPEAGAEQRGGRGGAAEHLNVPRQAELCASRCRSATRRAASSGARLTTNRAATRPVVRPAQAARAGRAAWPPPWSPPPSSGWPRRTPSPPSLLATLPHSEPPQRALKHHFTAGQYAECAPGKARAPIASSSTREAAQTGQPPGQNQRGNGL